MSEERVRPFYCGTQFIDWQDRNCCRCSKVDWEKEDCPSKCEIVIALSNAMWDDGTVSADIGRRMDAVGNELAHTWDCPERTQPVTEGQKA